MTIQSRDTATSSPKCNAKFPDWDIPNRYEIKYLIGTGSYGQVCAAYDSITQTEVAIKKVQNVFDDLVDCKRILREISILNRCDHPNIVKLVDICKPSSPGRFQDIYLVLELAGSDFKKLLRSSISLTENHIKLLMYNVLVGLNYLHEKGIYHRDLKPANCLVNQDCSVKICDFGLSRIIVERNKGKAEGVLPTLLPLSSIEDESKKQQNGSHQDPSLTSTHHHSYSSSGEGSAEGSKCSNINSYDSIFNDTRVSRNINLTSHVVTRWYRAPELILLSTSYDDSIDVWSMGCIFGEFLLSLNSNGVKSTSETSPLFPGTSCFPLSPQKKKSSVINDSKEFDQLQYIFSLIGTPSQDDINDVSNKDAHAYLSLFPHKAAINFRDKFKYCSNEALSLLKKMLVFNPKKRISVQEIIRDSYFDCVRNLGAAKRGEMVLRAVEESGKEGSTLSPSLSFQEGNGFNIQELRLLFIIEIAKYHPSILTYFKCPLAYNYLSPWRLPNWSELNGNELKQLVISCLDDLSGKRKKNVPSISDVKTYDVSQTSTVDPTGKNSTEYLTIVDKKQSVGSLNTSMRSSACQRSVSNSYTPALHESMQHYHSTACSNTLASNCSSNTNRSQSNHSTPNPSSLAFQHSSVLPSTSSIASAVNSLPQNTQTNPPQSNSYCVNASTTYSRGFPSPSTINNYGNTAPNNYTCNNGGTGYNATSNSNYTIMNNSSTYPSTHAGNNFHGVCSSGSYGVSNASGSFPGISSAANYSGVPVNNNYSVNSASNYVPTTVSTYSSGNLAGSISNYNNAATIQHNTSASSNSFNSNATANYARSSSYTTIPNSNCNSNIPLSSNNSSNNNPHTVGTIVACSNNFPPSNSISNTPPYNVSSNTNSTTKSNAQQHYHQTYHGMGYPNIAPHPNSNSYSNCASFSYNPIGLHHLHNHNIYQSGAYHFYQTLQHENTKQ